MFNQVKQAVIEWLLRKLSARPLRNETKELIDTVEEVMAWATDLSIALNDEREEVDAAIDNLTVRSEHLDAESELANDIADRLFNITREFPHAR